MWQITIIILTIVFFVFGQPDFLLNGESIVRAVSYHFFHANFFHLLANCLTFYFLFRTTTRRTQKDNARDLALSFLVASAVYGLSTRPLLGISNILFASTGMRTPSFSSPWWKNLGVRIFLITNIVLLFVPQVAGLTHIVSFSIGVAISAIRRKYKSICHDTRRAIGR